MRYQEIADFIENTMAMSHIYQPVMLMAILENEGFCNRTEIAARISSYDLSQMEYYKKIVTNMPGRVLRSHGVVEKNKEIYHLAGYENLSKEEVGQLLDLCQKRLDEYIEKRGLDIWRHRMKSGTRISGSLQYDVLKRSKFHCELCGISADLKSLQVDHIIPRNLGGSDDISNLQALCYSCNATKRDKDDTDLRAVRESYETREKGCVFCEVEKGRIEEENELALTIRDKHYVTELHTLIIPKRHIASAFKLGQAEINACWQLANTTKDKLSILDKDISGFNFGVNDGIASGQTIFHCHFHLIPRRDGDTPKPRGGVRGVIPDKMSYSE